MTRPEEALFTAIYYGFTVPPSYLPARAAQEDYNPEGRTVTEEECQAALQACLGKGWLQIIDEAALSKISEILRSGQVLGPIYRLPEVGGVDFTDAGADLWHRLDEGCGPDERTYTAYPDVIHEKTSRFYQSRAAALAGMEKARTEDEVVNVYGPFSTGPWRAQWWRRFPEGYRIDVEERRQWQGRACGGGEGCTLDRSHDKTDLRRLGHVLDHHKIGLAEWVSLAAMERPWRDFLKPGRFWSLVAFAEAHLGRTVTEYECRRGLESCLRNGLLRVIDRAAIDEIQGLLQNDPVVLPLAGEVAPCSGEIDFTLAGVSLYRTIAAEWLGSDWEDNFSVWKCYYWEEHHYCESEEGFHRVMQGHLDNGETARAKRLVPIGPWCIRWWNRFPVGYRLELEFGEP